MTDKTRHNRPTVALTLPNAGATKLLKILVSEAAYLIGITRCRRAIHGDDLTENETKAAWRRTLNRRISEDTTTASHVLHKPEYIKLIKNSWEKALQKYYGSIPDYWIWRGKGF